jgi:hypothetical protein
MHVNATLDTSPINNKRHNVVGSLDTPFTIKAIKSIQ